jgi:murein L,D-transpeptidase YcbB/YkuD
MRWPSFTDQHSAVESFYKPAGYALAWTVDANHPTEQALALITALQNADKQGLHPDDYDGPRWAERISRLQNSGSASAADLARFDLALTVSVMRYVSDQYRGRLSPNRFQFRWPVKECNLAEILRNQLVKSNDMAAALDQLQPPYAGYRRTLKALHDYVAMAEEGEGDPLPAPAKPVWSGDTYPGVQQLVKRLHRLGDLPLDVNLPAGSDLYEDNLKNAVKRFQQRHGLEPDGSLSPDTFKQLTTPLEHRIAQLQLTLELWRWLPADMKSPWIMVNVPEFRLRAFSDDRPLLSMSIIAGEAFKHETPMFVDKLEYLIFRPAWHVPLSIQQNEIIPELQRHPSYLDKEHFQIYDMRGRVVKVAAINDTILKQLRTGKLEVRQEPGSANGLGLVKFVFPKQGGVYLHGTLDRDLFGRLRRDFSHGCIRVEDPAALSAWVLKGDPRWNPQTIDTAMNGNLTMKVNLPQAVPVVIFYGTALVDENSEVHFSEDIYGYDAALEQALAKGRPYPE